MAYRFFRPCAWVCLLILASCTAPYTVAQSLSQPSVSSSPSDPVLGQDTTLTCILPDDMPQEEVTGYAWLKSFQVLPGETDETLIIDSLSAVDSGNYACLYTTQDAQSETSQLFPIFVGVATKPRLVSSGGGRVYFKAYVYDYMYLECQTNNTATNLFRFYHDGNYIGMDREGWHYLYYMNPGDSGLYTCTTSIDDDESEHSDPLTLIFVAPPELTVEPYNANLGDKAVMTCTPPLEVQGVDLSFQWHRNGLQINSTENPHAIESVAEEDVGSFTCSFQLVDRDQSLFHSGVSESYSLVLNPPGQPTLKTETLNLNYGKKYGFYCYLNTNGNGALGAEWGSLYQDGVKVFQTPLHEDSIDAYFDGTASYRSQGVYTCTISNRRGESPHSSQLSITVQAPEVYEREVDSPSLRVRTNKEFFNVIPCDTWHLDFIGYCTLYIDSERYGERHDCEFLVADSISGLYMCTFSLSNATSPTGPESKITFIDAPQVRPPARPLNLSQPISLYCATDAPSESVTWTLGWSRWWYDTTVEGTKWLDVDPTDFFKYFTCTVPDDERWYPLTSPVFQPNLEDAWISFTAYGQDQLALRDFSVTFSCYGSDFTSVSMYLNGIPVSTNFGSYSTFTVINAGLTGLTAFNCDGTNGLTETPRTKAEFVSGKESVKVVGSLPTPVMGQALTLTCQLEDYVQGDIIYYTWEVYREDDLEWLVDFDGPTVNINPVTEDDGGLYFCVIFINSTRTRISSHNLYPIIVSKSPVPPKMFVAFLNDEKSKESATQLGGIPALDVLDLQDLLVVQCYCESYQCFGNNRFRLYKYGTEITDATYSEGANADFSEVVSWIAYLINMKDSNAEGIYTCTTHNNYGESEHSSAVEITRMKYMPRPSVIADKPSAMVGDDLELGCSLPPEVPPHLIEWKKDGVPILHQGHTLALPGLTEDDSGTYTCKYTVYIEKDMEQSPNEYRGEYIDSYPFLLQLKGPLQPNLNRVSDPDKRTQDEAYLFFYMSSPQQPVYLSCAPSLPGDLASYKQISMTFHLYQDDVLVQSKTDSYVFTVTDLTTGNYSFSCTGENSIGVSARSFPLPLSVRARPVITAVPTSPNMGHDLTLTCETDWPSSWYNIIWYKNGAQLSETSSTLQMTDVSQYHEGRYTCRMLDRPWHHPVSDDYVLAWPPVKPVLYSMGMYTYKGSKAIVLYCISVSSTATHVTFYLDSTQIHVAVDPELDDAGHIIFSYMKAVTTGADSGSYTCTVDNVHGESPNSDVVDIQVGGEVTCTPGFRLTASGRCDPCPVGTYQPEENQDSCIPCEAGQFTLSPASFNVSQCITIPQAQHIYLRVSTSGSLDGDQLVQDFHQLFSSQKSFLGINTYGSVTSQNNKNVLILSVVYRVEVTSDLQVNLGVVIYRAYYDSQSDLEVNMFVSQTDATNDVDAIDINECVIPFVSVCSQLETCSNVEGRMGSFACVCVTGYHRPTSSADCIDYDECSDSSTVCEGANEECVNTDGSYKCDCEDGYLRRTPQDKCTDFKREWAKFYSYGNASGDSELKAGDNEISQTITIKNGLPFGSQKYNFVQVSTNGMISVGSSLTYWYWGELEYQHNLQHMIISPFMADLDTSYGGVVFYGLHKNDSEGNSDVSADVLQQAEEEVRDNMDASGFVPTQVLVVTWEAVRSRMSTLDEVTFQAVIITDGRKTFTTFRYKKGKMNWPHVTGRSVIIGFANDIGYQQLMESDSYLTSQMDTLQGNTGHYGTYFFLVGDIKNPDQECANFLKKNAYLLHDQTFESQVASLFQCPCSLTQLGRQWQQLEMDGDRVCFALSSLVTRFFPHTTNRLCCYRLPNPGIGWRNQPSAATYIDLPPETGYVTRYNPFSWSDTYRKYLLQDDLPYRWCCVEAEDTDLCPLFYQVRPSSNCSDTAIMISGV